MLLLWEFTVLLHPSGLALWPWPDRRWWAGTCSTLFPFMSLAPAEGWGMEWPDAGCGMQLAAFHVLVDRLSVLLEVKHRPPVKPSRCLDLSSCEVVDWKTVEGAGASTWPGRATCLCCGPGRASSH